MTAQGPNTKTPKCSRLKWSILIAVLQTLKVIKNKVNQRKQERQLCLEQLLKEKGNLLVKVQKGKGLHICHLCQKDFNTVQELSNHSATRLEADFK